MSQIPQTMYAQAAGDVNIAYQVVGTEPVDLIFVPGFVSNLDLFWEIPRVVRIWEQDHVVRSPHPLRQATTGG